MTIGETLIGQFDRVWQTLREGIEKIPEEHWRSGEIDFLVPARQGHHAIQAVEFYARPEEKGFDGTARFGVHGAKAPADKLPTQKQMLEYLEEIRERVSTLLGQMSDVQMLAPKKAFPWTGPNILARAVYTLRHTQAHIGELNSELRRRGLERAEWK